MPPRPPENYALYAWRSNEGGGFPFRADREHEGFTTPAAPFVAAQKATYELSLETGRWDLVLVRERDGAAFRYRAEVKTERTVYISDAS